MGRGTLGACRAWAPSSTRWSRRRSAPPTARACRAWRASWSPTNAAEALPLTAEATRLLEKNVGRETLRLRRPLELRAQELTEAGWTAEVFPNIERVASLVTKAGGDESDQAAERLLRADALWVEGMDRKGARAEAARAEAVRAEAARAEAALATVKGIEGDLDKKAVLDGVRAWRKAHR